MKKYLIIFFSLLMLLSGCKDKKVENITYKKVKIEAYYNYNNNPTDGVFIEAYNFETAYRKVKSGHFSKNDFTHYTFDSVKKQYEVSKKKIKLNQFSFGQGVKNSSEDAKMIVGLLFENNRDYLTYMNGLKPQVNLVNPENPRYKFTDKNGKIIGNIESGLTILKDTTGSLDYKIINAKNGLVVYLGDTIPAKKPILVNNKNVKKSYSVDVGQEVSYTVPVTSKKMSIAISPNFQVSSVNQSYESKIELNLEKMSLKGQIVNVSNSPRIFDNKIKYYVKKDELNQRDNNEINREIAQSVSKLQSIDRLDFNFTNDKPKSIVIKGHIASKRTYTLPVVIERPDETTEIINKKFDIYDTKSSQGIFVIENGKKIMTPQLKSYGINFATYDGRTNKPVSGISFMLGKVVNGEVYFMSKQDSKATWKNSKMGMKKFLKKKSIFNPYKIEGNQYTFSDGTTYQLPMNDNLWVYDLKSQSKENNPLIKLRGLSKGSHYFLLPLNNADKIVNDNKPLYFKVDHNSIDNAKLNNYELNGYISDMKYGQEEYNAIKIVNAGEKTNLPINPLLKTLVILVGIFTVYATIIILMVRRK